MILPLTLEIAITAETVAKATLMTPSPPRDAEAELEIDLRDPSLSALLAWLWPGAGHLYQRRTGKGLLFMICILATYFFGLCWVKEKLFTLPGTRSIDAGSIRSRSASAFPPFRQSCKA